MTKKTLGFLLVCMIAIAPAARATTVPDSDKDQLTKSCMGGESPQQDPQRAEYCGCMRDSMNNWSAEEFKDVAAESAHAKSADQEPQKLQELAKACITKVMGNPQ